MIRHGLRYGCCAILYVGIPNAPKDDFDTVVPRVMDPVSEYSLRWRVNEDGTRDYMAYERSRISQNTPIEHTRVFVFDDPTYDGTLNSPIQKSFAALHGLSSYWRRHEERDYRGTHPPYLFEYESSKEGLIANSIPPEAVPEYDQEIQHNVGARVDTQQMQQMYATDVGNSFIQQRWQRRNDRNGEVPEDLYELHWNPELNRYSRIPMATFWEPQRLLDQNVRLARGIPTPTHLPNFERVIEDLTRIVSNALGIPAEVLFGGKGNFAADVQFSNQQLNTTVTRWQRILERFLSLVYLDIYHTVHVDVMTDILNRMEGKRKEDYRQREKQARKESPKEDSENPPKREGGLGSVLVSCAARIAFENSMIVHVRFSDNPMFDYATLKMYRDDGIMSHEDFQRLALSMANLPQSMALSQKQIEDEARKDARVQEIREPQKEDVPSRDVASSKKRCFDSDKDISSKLPKTQDVDKEKAKKKKNKNKEGES